MRDTTRAETLLSLFTSPDCAAAIAGDLTEERQHRGSIWFWLHVSRTALALWRSAVTGAPLIVLMLAVAGGALLAGPAFGGAAAVNLFPQWSDSPVTWIARSCVWWGGALCAGASLVALAPRRGMAACMTLAVAGEALLIAFIVSVPWWRDPLSTQLVVFYTTAVVVAAPLLIGAAMARRRLIAWGIPAMEPHR